MVFYRLRLFDDTYQLRCPNLPADQAIFMLMTTGGQPITLPLAHAHGVIMLESHAVFRGKYSTFRMYSFPFIAHTMWRVIFGGAKFHEKSKPAFKINFRDFNFRDCHPNERVALRGCACIRVRMIVHTPSDHFRLARRGTRS